MTPEIARVLRDPNASEWLKAALRSAVDRDDLEEAVADAQYLAELVDRHCARVTAASEALGLDVGELLRANDG